jgi:hypothetical protein
MSIDKVPKRRRGKSTTILLQPGLIEEHFPGEKLRIGNKGAALPQKMCANSQKD